MLARHPVFRWPARVGRSYEADVILEDPFIAAQHVQIEPAADGKFAVSDLQTLNGINLPPSSERVDVATLGAEDVMRLGHTQLRIRSRSYGVPPELRLRRMAWYRTRLAFGIAAVAVFALTVWNFWIMTAHREEATQVVFPVLFVAAMLALWVSVWALVSRATGGRANFSAHGAIACAGMIAWGLWESSFDYLSFGFDAAWLKHVGSVGVAAILAYALYRHLRLNSRAAPRRLAIVGSVVAASAFAVAAGIELAVESTRQALQTYDHTLKAPPFVFVTGSTPSGFFAEGETLRRKVDALASKP